MNVSYTRSGHGRLQRRGILETFLSAWSSVLCGGELGILRGSHCTLECLCVNPFPAVYLTQQAQTVFLHWAISSWFLGTFLFLLVFLCCFNITTCFVTTCIPYIYLTVVGLSRLDNSNVSLLCFPFCSKIVLLCSSSLCMCNVTNWSCSINWTECIVTCFPLWWLAPCPSSHIVVGSSPWQPFLWLASTFTAILQLFGPQLLHGVLLTVGSCLRP